MQWSEPRCRGLAVASPDPQTERLSAIIDGLNERHALNLTITDALLFSTVRSRMDANADIFKAINDDKGFADDLKASYGRDVYLALRDQ